jgi:hypothetical protein
MVKSSLQNAVNEKVPTIGLNVTGSNTELMKLALDYRMKITDNFLLMSTKPFPNFSNYLIYPTGSLL